MYFFRDREREIDRIVAFISCSHILHFKWNKNKYVKFALHSIYLIIGSFHHTDFPGKIFGLHDQFTADTNFPNRKTGNEKKTSCSSNSNCCSWSKWCWCKIVDANFNENVNSTLSLSQMLWSVCMLFSFSIFVFTF